MKPFLNTKFNINNRFLERKINHFYITAGGTCFLTKKQFDSCIRIIRFYIKRFKKKKKVVSLAHFNVGVTKRVEHTRMGSGKGKLKHFYCRVNINKILFIFKNVKLSIMKDLFIALKHRLPIPIFLIFKS